VKNVAFGWLWFFTPYNIYQCSQFEPIDQFLALLFMLELTVKDICTTLDSCFAEYCDPTSGGLWRVCSSVRSCPH
jgi:hypothetical protein